MHFQQRLSVQLAVITLVSGMASALARAVTVWGVDSNTSGGDRVVKFDSSNPAGTIVSIGNTGVSGLFMSGLDFDAAGTLYAISASLGATGSLYTINQTNGQATLVGSLAIPAGRDMNDLTYNLAAGQFYGVAFDGQNNYLYTIDPSTGAAGLVGTINSPGSIFLGICADSSGQMYLEDVNGRMRVLNGLNATPMPEPIGVPTIFSQGMTMDWSNGDAWYLAATWQSPPGSFFARGDFRLMNNATGGTTQILGTWPQLPNNSYPVYAIGDVAIKPIPESVCGVVVGLAILLRRARRAGA